MNSRGATKGAGEEPARAEINHTVFDLAVIGAGPSGALAAALAAEAGLKAVVIERKRMPRSKPCGGFVSVRALNLLPPGFVATLGEEAEIKTLNVAWRGRAYSCHAADRLGLLVRREDFDRRLADYATLKGALLIEGKTCRALSSSTEPGRGGPLYRLDLSEGEGVRGRLTARSVIGADGALGTSGRLFGLRGAQKLHTGWGLSCFAETGRTGPACGELNFFPLPRIGGMGWSFKGRGFTNRGVGGAVGISALKNHFHRLFPGEKNRGPAEAWPLPYLGPLRAVARDNLVLVGDAAGLVEPFSGEGLYNCFKSVRLACRALATLDGGGSGVAAEYNRLFNRHFRRPFAGAVLEGMLLYGTAPLRPSALPGLIASLMNNRLFLRRDRDLPGPGRVRQDSP